ncbi:MAG: hypothetical protein LBB80_10605, partial [Treponema sp.]|nr:hypothetical protein [Treponema sp.]
MAEKNRTKGVARLRFFVARTAYWRRSIYSPVEAVGKVDESQKLWHTAPIMPRYKYFDRSQGL